ncbi:NAD(P)/FAD-dependent oxidoreductase [Prosthecomicrobium sp. N25]|uniref:NAD(P)/FAD-dependent oxidoreductase n=1 Tax=Prosthecomicrobium sp. N25 TaxID=3129254 RepID=UPI003076A446
MRIAVVGTGISGNAAAWALHRDHEIVVYEKETRAGGHANTVEIDYDGRRIPVDTGFIVYNELNYPNLTALFHHLGVVTQPSDMSFAVSVDGGKREWKGGEPLLSGLFAMKRSIFSPSHLWMLREVLRFNRTATADREAGLIGDASLGHWLEARGFRGRFVSDYIVPMGAAIWSTPQDQMLNFPAASFVTFFENHRLIHMDRPLWRTVAGGSRSYVEKLTAPFADRIRTGAEVVRVERADNRVTVTDTTGRTERFDQIVFASHTDETLRTLADASPAEREILGAVRYRPNEAILHRDANLMPRRRGAWASWNVLTQPSRPETLSDVCVTYWMNALQGIPAAFPLFVTLNPPADRQPDPGLVFARFSYDHPQYDRSAIVAQRRLDEIQGRRNTWFCGAWTGYGFHEDGLLSGLAVAERLGAAVPWRLRERVLEAAE